MAAGSHIVDNALDGFVEDRGAFEGCLCEIDLGKTYGIEKRVRTEGFAGSGLDDDTAAVPRFDDALPQRPFLQRIHHTRHLIIDRRIVLRYLKRQLRVSFVRCDVISLTALDEDDAARVLKSRCRVSTTGWMLFGIRQL